MHRDCCVVGSDVVNSYGAPTAGATRREDTHLVAFGRSDLR